jgi:glycosyltransferase involved in cell wall biosynthesis
MFSIIIPVYNVDKYLDKCLQSVVKQTYEDIEIIIVNDGSTDSSSRIIDEYRSDNRIKVITQENGGLSAARNSGLKLVTKEYVMFIDSDDFIAANTCERLAEYVEKDKSDVYVFGLYYDYGHKKDIGGQCLRYKKYENGKKYMEVALKEGNFRTFAPSKLFRNNVLGAGIFAYSEKINFINELLYEDMFFVVQVFCKAKSVSVVPEFFYHYVQHQCGRITAQYRKKDLDVLTFINMLRNGYYKTGEINKFIYAVLTFRWVSSCLIYKYIKDHFFNKQAMEMIEATIKDENFIEAVKLCAKERGIPKRDKYLAKLLDASPFLYKIAVYFLVAAKGILR